jgi:hypothetical protein
MPRVVPSQVVAFIDSIALPPNEGFTTYVTSIDTSEVAGLADLLDQIPEELIVLDSADYASFICSKARIRETISTWAAQAKPGPETTRFLYSSLVSAIAGIRYALTKSPDESPAPGTSELSFITDTDLRENLRSDIGGIERALSNGEWKAATVLAGSTIEAILLWDIANRRAATYPGAVLALVGNGTFRQKPSNNPDEWVLHHYIEVAAHLGIIKPDTVTEARLAKDFRNLIHPGRAQRLGQSCDRGTALSCVAALEHVVRDLT